MKTEFWHERWENQEIGFHQKAFNKNLQRHWPSLQLPKHSKVLVPLCGKSLDMLYLAEQGHQVLGVELSEIAAQEFFAEQGLVPEIHKDDKFVIYQAQGIAIYCGDIFDLDQSLLSDVKGVFDRAAMIALPPEMRQRYCETLAASLPADCKTLLLTLEYPQEETSPPPFSISREMVSTSLDQLCDVNYLDSSEDEVRNHQAVEHCFILKQQP